MFRGGWVGEVFDESGFDEEGVGNCELEKARAFFEEDGTFAEEGRKVLLPDGNSIDE